MICEALYILIFGPLCCRPAWSGLPIVQRRLQTTGLPPRYNRISTSIHMKRARRVAALNDLHADHKIATLTCSVERVRRQLLPLLGSWFSTVTQYIYIAKLRPRPCSSCSLALDPRSCCARTEIHFPGVTGVQNWNKLFRNYDHITRLHNKDMYHISPNQNYIKGALEVSSSQTTHMQSWLPKQSYM